MKLNERKFRCNKGECTAELPEVFCDRVRIVRREIPHFVVLMDMLGDALIAYHILPPESEDGKTCDAFDGALVFIWVNPEKHITPDYLVQAAANVACGSFTMNEEKEFIRTYDKTLFLKWSREVNCPVCAKNHVDGYMRAMSYDEYITRLKAIAGGHE